jgi:hypothetical protein
MPKSFSPPQAERLPRRRGDVVAAAIRAESPPDYLAKSLEESAGQGTSSAREDTAFWLTPEQAAAEQRRDKWIAALDDIDARGSKGKDALVELLRSKSSIPLAACERLIERLSFGKRDPGAPKRAVDFTEHTVRLYFAADRVPLIQKKHRLTRDQAIEVVAELTRIDKRSIASACRGDNKAVLELKRRAEAARDADGPPLFASS